MRHTFGNGPARGTRSHRGDGRDPVRQPQQVRIRPRSPSVRLDRTLYSSVHYPCDYGFIEDTLADDGDPLDVLVVIAEPTFPGCVVRARPVGVLDMVDEKGHDYKILAVAHDDPRWESTNALEDLSPHRLREIENFFETYKSLENRPTEVNGWLGVDDAWRIIDAARASVGTSEPEAGTWR